SPASLVFEITETAAITNLTVAKKFIETLKGIGFRFALDDFGVGFASFEHLKFLPVDYLKIDGSFIKELPNSSVDQHVVRGIVEVAHGLGKQVIAEHVENEAILEILKTYGIDFGQGFYLGRPFDPAQQPLHPRSF
ncbi:MAG TPA: EAL domain-containing protein, partial [Dehalococcoidia bacterium]|nr:EAL domain-containing protein [Dehalococcoidia bacterium]